MATRYPVDSSLQAPLTVEKYHRMIDAGILGADDRVELLEGVLVEMGPQSHRHAKFISRFNAAVARIPALQRAIGARHARSTACARSAWPAG